MAQQDGLTRAGKHDYTDEQLDAGMSMLRDLRGRLGEHLSDETLCGCVYDVMRAKELRSGGHDQEIAALVERLNALRAKATTEYEWASFRVPASATGGASEPWAPWLYPHGPRTVVVDKGYCIHADDMDYIAALVNAWPRLAAALQSSQAPEPKQAVDTPAQPDVQAQTIEPTNAMVSACLQTFRREIDIHMDTKHPSSSPGHDAMRIALRAALALPAAQSEQERDWVRVPREPTEAMWNGLARDLVMWWGMGDRPTGNALYRHLSCCGRNIPSWLFDEIPNTDHVPPKGTVAVCIYKAMLAT